MQTVTEKIWKLKPPYGLFNGTVVHNLFPDLSPGARKALVHRALRKGEVLTLKPGLYCLGPALNITPPHPFVISGMLHSPSYVSMESALWHHQLIPEALFQINCVTAQRSRIYHTPLGVFSFFRVPCRQLKAGVSVIRLNHDAWAFVAQPLRAIADLIYKNRDVSWNKDGIKFLTESLRIEDDDWKSISLDDFNEIYQSFRNMRVKKYLSGLKKEIRG